MKQPKCRTCGKEHALGICPEFKSTAARKDVREQLGPTAVVDGSKPSPVLDLGKLKGASKTPPEPAGTQALPVDTNSEPFDRKKYQMLFMRDKRKADKLGLKVSEYRKLKGEDK